MKALDLLPKLTPEVMEKINGILGNAPAVAVRGIWNMYSFRLTDL